jgi:hypothetical protein
VPCQSALRETVVCPAYGARHLWCVNPVNGRVKCGCGLVCTNAVIWSQFDPDAFADFVDPNGVQRAFCALAGITPTAALLDPQVAIA